MNPLTSQGSTSAATDRASQAAAAALRELPEALVLVFDAELRIVLAAGRALARVADRSGKPHYQAGAPLAATLPEELWRTVEPLAWSALVGETRSREIWTPGEHCLLVDVGPLCLPTPGDDDEAGGIALLMDATERRRADLLDAVRHGALDGAFDRPPSGTGLLDGDGRWLLVNRSLCEITGYTAEELVGKRFDGIIHPDDAFNDAAQRERLLAGEIPALQVEKRYFDASGETVSALLSMSLVRDGEGEALYYVARLQDVSERRQLEDQLRRLADHDELTGVRNRKLFLHDLHLQVARSHRYGEAAGLLVIDVEGLAAINEQHGRDAGDEALRAVARALTRRLRQTDLVGRLGGDEFAVLLPHVDEEGAAVVAEGLQRVIPASGVDVGEAVVHPNASIGFTLIDEATTTAQEALTAAARSLQFAKRTRGGDD